MPHLGTLGSPAGAPDIGARDKREMADFRNTLIPVFPSKGRRFLIVTLVYVDIG
jgi:hypothetical protein